MPAQPPSYSSRCQVRPVSKCSRSPQARSRRARIAGACSASHATASVRNAASESTGRHPNRFLDTCKGACQDRIVFHDPATFTHGFPHDTFRALRADDPVSHHDHPTWKRGYWVIARHADVQRVSRDSATFANAPHPFLDAEIPEDGDGGMSDLLISQDPPTAHEAAEADQQGVHAPPRRGARRPRPRAGRQHRGRARGPRRVAISSPTSRCGCPCT